MNRKDIKKSVGCDARSAELLDAMAAEWGVSHAEAMRRCIWMAAGPMSRRSTWIRRIVTAGKGVMPPR